MVARYTQGLGVDQPLAMLRSGTTSYFDADGLGSVTSLSNSSGALAATYTYDSFGKLTGSSGTITNPYRFTGREADSETGLDYYRARYYDPQIGRFVSEDPLGFVGSGTDLYQYVLNDPTSLTDPTGLCPVNCDTKLPDGRTVGDVVREMRRTMQSTLDAAIQSAESAGTSDLLEQMTATFYSIAKSGGSIDFKNTFRGGTLVQRHVLADAGNFAYYAIGSGYLPDDELDAGAGYYGLRTAILGNRPFSELTGRMFSDSSAARVRDAALAASGCQR